MKVLYELRGVDKEGEKNTIQQGVTLTASASCSLLLDVKSFAFVVWCGVEHMRGS